MANQKPAAKAKASVAAKPAAGKKAVASQRMVEFGSVKMFVRQPTTVETRKRINESKAVVRKLGKTIAKPGVRLSHTQTTPIYTVDTKDPNLVVQKIGNKAIRGHFIKGSFVAV